MTGKKLLGCIRQPGHNGECFVGTRGYACHDEQLEAEIARLRAENAELRAKVKEAENAARG